MSGARAGLELVIRSGLEVAAVAWELEVSGLLPDAPRPAAPARCGSCGSCGSSDAHRLWVSLDARCGSSWHGVCACGGCAL